MNAQAELLVPGVVERDSAGLPVVTPPMEGLDRLIVLTSWTRPLPEEDDEKEADRLTRDQLFRAAVVSALRTYAPWLVPLLVAAGATVIAMPGRAYYLSFEEGSAQLIEIPNLGNALLLLPWAEPGEPMQ